MRFPNGGTIAIPNDPTNGGRALLLLQDKGVIKLNPSRLQADGRRHRREPEEAEIRRGRGGQTPRALEDVDAAAINTNYATPAGLDPQGRDPPGGAEGPYVNVWRCATTTRTSPG